MTESLVPGEAWRNLIVPIWDNLSFYETWEVLQSGFAKINEKQKYLYAVYCADYEICNGGFEQFFSNSTGMLGPEAVAGYHAIGMIECAELVHEACLMLGIPYPRERAERRERLEKLFTYHARGKNIFDDMERRYYVVKYEEAGGLDAAADRYASIA